MLPLSQIEPNQWNPNEVAGDTFKQRFWTPVEKQEALTLAEYLEAAG